MFSLELPDKVFTANMLDVCNTWAIFLIDLRENVKVCGIEEDLAEPLMISKFSKVWHEKFAKQRSILII